MEVLVQVSPDQIVRDFRLAVFELPDADVLTVNNADLPGNWNSLEYGDVLKNLGE